MLGGVAGSMLGKGSRANLAGAAAGAVLGAVGGSMAESKITEQTSTEFTVREESGGWNDRVFDRSENFGTAMTLMALLEPKSARPVGWTVK